jgi:hypothetical protein
VSAVRKQRPLYSDSALRRRQEMGRAFRHSHLRKESGQTKMAKTPPNNGKAWSNADNRQLDKLIKGNTPTGLMAHKLGRSEDAVRSHVSATNRSVKPTNQSPYNRRKA